MPLPLKRIDEEEPLTDHDMLQIACILKYYPSVNVTYRFSNRTPHMKFSREAVDWLQDQINSKPLSLSLSLSLPLLS